MSDHPHQPERVFDFRFDPLYRLAGSIFGVRPGTTLVRLTDDGDVDARFGPWRLRTPLSNVVSTSVSGPYHPLLTAGPARLSLADRGLTFATNRDLGVCLRFAGPVPAIEPFGLLHHPGLTVTVSDPHGLAAAIEGARAG